eukprot:Seg1870.5 transcript_id=Seg1870.5/GoldUCD/mRNA.D3Y31 product="Ribosome-binding factor A" protein_id=Seg1870.5/GoldUCD/D3Y31
MSAKMWRRTVFLGLKEVQLLDANKSILRCICSCPLLQNKDKYSLKNIGANKPRSWGQRKAPNFAKSGGSKSFPVAVFQLPKQRHGDADLQQSSRHKSMIENALQDAIESVLFSGGFNDLLAGSIIEITKVDLSPNFSSATVYWRYDVIENGPPEEEVVEALDQNVDFIRNMLPAYHSMTHTPYVTFIRDLRMEKEQELEKLFSEIDKLKP